MTFVTMMMKSVADANTSTLLEGMPITNASATAPLRPAPNIIF